MVFKRFLGVWFDDTWAIVPRKWVFKDGSSSSYKCYWPTSGSVEQSSRSEEIPNRKKWSIWNIEEPDISNGKNHLILMKVIEDILDYRLDYHSACELKKDCCYLKYNST